MEPFLKLEGHVLRDAPEGIHYKTAELFESARVLLASGREGC